MKISLSEEKLMKLTKLIKTDFFLILILVFLALCLRIHYSSSLSLDFYSDDAIYMSMARSFYEGDFSKIIHIHWRPFYPLVSAAFYPFFRDWAVTARAVPILFGSLLVVPIFLLMRSLSNRMFAFLTGLYVSCFKPLITASTLPLAESLLTFLIWTGFFFLWQAIRSKSGKIRWTFWAGILWSLALLAKSEATLFLGGLMILLFLYSAGVIVCCYLQKAFLKEVDVFFLSLLIFGALLFSLKIYQPIFNLEIVSLPQSVVRLIFIIGAFLLFSFLFSCLAVFRFHWLKAVLRKLNPVFLLLVPFGIGFLLIQTPYKIAYRQKFDHPPFLAKLNASIAKGSSFVLNKEGNSTWAQDVFSVETVNPKSEFFEFPKQFSPALFLDILINDGLKRATFFIQKFLFSYFSFPERILFFLGIFWLLVSYKDRRAFPFFTIIGLVVFWGLAFLTPSINERKLYSLLPIFPIGIFLGGYALTEYKLIPNFKFLILLTVVFFGFFLTQGRSYFPIEEFFSGQRKIQQKQGIFTQVDIWLLENDPGSRVMTTHEGVGFYSRSFLIYTPQVRSLAELVEYAKKWRVDYLVALPEELPTELRFLHSDPKDYPGLRPVYGHHREIRAKIYKVL